MSESNQNENLGKLEYATLETAPNIISRYAFPYDENSMLGLCESSSLASTSGSSTINTIFSNGGYLAASNEQSLSENSHTVNNNNNNDKENQKNDRSNSNLNTSMTEDDFSVIASSSQCTNQTKTKRKYTRRSKSPGTKM